MNRIARSFSDWITGSGPELERRFHASTAWPAWLILLTVAACCGWIVWLYRRDSGARRWRTFLAALRISLLLLVVAMMQGWTIQEFRTDRPDLLILLDDSLSMLRQTGNAESPPRLESAVRRLLEHRGLLEQLESNYRVKLYRVARTTRAEPTGKLVEALESLELRGDAPEHLASRLGDGAIAVLQAQRGRPTAAVLMVTDGLTTDGASLLQAGEEASRRNTPLFLIGAGRLDAVQDVQVADLTAERTAFVGDLLTFQARLAAPGFEGQPVRLQLFREGASAPLQEVVVTAVAGDQVIQLTHRAEATGEQVFRVEAAPLEGEATLENNRQTARVTIRDVALRVLLLSERPTFDYQSLKNALGRGLQRDSTPGRRTRAVELACVLQESDPQYAEQDEHAIRVFPASREELFQYDALIVSDADPRGLSNSQMENIVAFVEQRGGGLALLAGPRHLPQDYRGSPLERLLPIELDSLVPSPAASTWTTPYRPQRTDIGRSAAQLEVGDTPDATGRAWEQMPPLYWLVEAPGIRRGVRVLLEHPARRRANGAGLPIVTTHFFGAGAVVFHGTDESYRWARHPEGPQFYARYWLQTLRRLCRSKLNADQGVELLSDRDEYPEGEAVLLRVKFLNDRLAPPEDDGVTLMVEGEGGRRRPVRLFRRAAARERFEGRVEGLPPGQFRAWLAAPSISAESPPAVVFQVLPARSEDRVLQVDVPQLRRAAEASGGEFHTLDTLDRLVRRLPPGKQVRVEPLPPRAIWNSPLVAALCVLLLVAEWIGRRRCGMA